MSLRLAQGPGTLIFKQISKNLKKFLKIVKKVKILNKKKYNKVSFLSWNYSNGPKWTAEALWRGKYTELCFTSTS